MKSLTPRWVAWTTGRWGLLVIGIGTVSTAINFLVTIAALRAPGMSFKRLPLFTWMTAVNSFLIILAFPRA